MGMFLGNGGLNGSPLRSWARVFNAGHGIPVGYIENSRKATRMFWDSYKVWTTSICFLFWIECSDYCGVPTFVEVQSPACLSSCFLPRNSSACSWHTRLPWCVTLPEAPNLGPTDPEVEPPKLWAKQPFLFAKWPSQVCCHRDGKLINAPYE